MEVYQDLDMTTDLTTSAAQTEMIHLVSQAGTYIENAKSANTVRAYQSDWTDFTVWCESHAVASLPASPETVALYLTAAAVKVKAGTLTRRVSSISQAHQIAGFETPTSAAKVRLVMAGIRRTKGTAQIAKKPVLVTDLRQIVGALPETLLGVRDRALLLMGFAGAFRRSELVALDVADIEFNREGLTVTIGRSKTDQEGQGRKVGLPYGSNLATCPVRALQEWLAQANITEGPIFRPINRHGHVSAARLAAESVADVVKRYAGAVGFDATEFAGHSLRSGLATSAAMAGVSERSIMAQTGHKSVAMVRRYIRNGSLFRENAAAGVGL
jgi:site-specific recombinase XerD